MNYMSKVIGAIRQRKIDKGVFFLALVLLIGLDYFTAASFQMLFSGRLTQLIIILLGIKILCTSYSKKEWIILGCGAVLSVISFFYTDSYLVAEFIMLIMAAKDMNLRQIMKVYVSEVSIITILVGVLALLGIRGEVFIESNFRGDGLEIRYAMGFDHPNVYHIILIQLMMAYLWLLWDKIKKYHLIILFALNCVVTYFTDSRTSFLVGSAIFIAYMLAKCVPKITQWIGLYIFGIMIFAVCMLVSYAAMIYGTTIPVLQKMNEIWTGRILWAYYSFQSYITERPISFFADMGNVVRCDMSFVNMMLLYGIVMVLLLATVMIGLLIKAFRKRNFLLLVSAVACILFFFGETFSSGEYITRNLLFVFMLGWDYSESIKSKESIY